MEPIDGKNRIVRIKVTRVDEITLGNQIKSKKNIKFDGNERVRY